MKNRQSPLPQSYPAKQWYWQDFSAAGGWLKRAAAVAADGRLPLLSLLAYLLGRAPLVPGIYPFGLAAVMTALKLRGPLAGFIVLVFAARGMTAQLPSSTVQYWFLVGSLTCGAAVLPYFAKLRTGSAQPLPSLPY